MLFCRYAIVTGANRGIGFEICRGLASNGINIVLTARDKKKGLEALEKLKGYGFSDTSVFFHQLDVANLHSISTLAEFVKSEFGRLDILVFLETSFLIFKNIMNYRSRSYIFILIYFLVHFLLCFL